jgi:ribosome biogenesis GTPase A
MKQEIIDISALAVKLIEILGNIAPGAVEARYGIEKNEPRDILERLCIKRGFLLKEGEIDIERGAKTLLDEFRGGKLGRITLERPV